MTTKRIKCCICGQEIEDIYSNNPYPYKKSGRCCDDCNYEYVLPARLQVIYSKSEDYKNE